jgi:uncharacterized membrane protein YebE (DUF533 family)
MAKIDIKSIGKLSGILAKQAADPYAETLKWNPEKYNQLQTLPNGAIYPDVSDKTQVIKRGPTPKGNNKMPKDDLALASRPGAIPTSNVRDTGDLALASRPGANPTVKDLGPYALQPSNKGSGLSTMEYAGGAAPVSAKPAMSTMEYAGAGGGPNTVERYAGMVSPAAPAAGPGAMNRAGNWIKNTWNRGAGGKAGLIGGAAALGGLGYLGYDKLFGKKPEQEAKKQAAYIRNKYNHLFKFAMTTEEYAGAGGGPNTVERYAGVSSGPKKPSLWEKTKGAVSDAGNYVKDKWNNTSTAGKIGIGAAGAAAVGGAGYLAHKAMKGKDKEDDKKEEKKEEKKASLGTPFTDGLLFACQEMGLNGEQVADVLQKGASYEGKLGEECSSLINRMLED